MIYLSQGCSSGTGEALPARIFPRAVLVPRPEAGLSRGPPYPCPMIRIKRIYEEPSEDDGLRVLVDRLWPRGISKERALIDRWEKDLAPTTELRRWFGHDPAKWEEFLQRYRAELEGREELLTRLQHEANDGTVTLLYAAKDEEHNNAVALKRYIEEG
mgnify:CR=1 FL=1